ALLAVLHQVEGGLLHRSRAAAEEAAPAARPGGAERPAREDLPQPLLQLRPARVDVEHRAGVGALLRDPGSNLLRAGVLEPPVGVVDLDSVDGLDHLADRRKGRFWGQDSNPILRSRWPPSTSLCPSFRRSGLRS